MNLQNMTDWVSSDAANDDETGRCGTDTVSQSDMTRWLVLQLADHVGLDASEIDIQKPCAAYGLDSMTGVSIAGDLEVWLGLPLSPTLLWDYPSIDRVSQCVIIALEEEGGKRRRRPIAASMEAAGSLLDAAEAARLLAQLGTLSDAEVETMLHALQAA